MVVKDVFGEPLDEGDIIVVVNNKGDFDLDFSKGRVTNVGEVLEYIYYKTPTGQESFAFPSEVMKVGESYNVWLVPFRRDVGTCQEHEFCRDFGNRDV